MRKNKLLIIDKHHFGTLTDSYKWCEYLRHEFDITLICFDTGNPKIIMDHVNIKYVNYSGSALIRGIRFLLISLFNIMFFNGKILVVYFEKCNILKKFFPKKRMLLDIRTLSVNVNASIRQAYDTKLINTCTKYDLITVISKGIKDKINLPNKNIQILPLGADCISHESKNYNTIKLLYVGTLTGRNIGKTITGLSTYIHNYNDTSIHYDIIGDGNNHELDQCIELASKLNIDKFITFHGRLPYQQLTPFFDKCNVGVSFIPITDYFNEQPPTKTYEYALSGLYTIATKTNANSRIINDSNGFLITDTPEDFTCALEYIRQNKNNIDETTIRDSLKKHSWENIVNNHLKPILANL